MIIDQLFTSPLFEQAPMASPEQLAYNRLRAQHDSYQTMTSGGGNTAVSRDPVHAAKIAKVPAELARMAAVLKAKGIDAEAQYDALSGPTAAPVDANQLYEFAPSDDDSNGSDPEELLRRMAVYWWNGNEKQMSKVENTLAAMGWEIGQDEGYDDGGVFVVRAGDEHGGSYISWPHDDLELNEGRKKKNKKTSRSLGRYFFPGFGYYGSGESGEGGGDGGGGESADPAYSESGLRKFSHKKNRFRGLDKLRNPLGEEDAIDPSRRGFLKKAAGAAAAGAAMSAAGPEIVTLVKGFAEQAGGMNGIQALKAMLKIATADELYNMYDYQADSGILADAITDSDMRALQRVKGFRDYEDWSDFEEYCEDNNDVNPVEEFERLTGRSLKVSLVNDILEKVDDTWSLEDFFDEYPDALKIINPFENGSISMPTMQQLANINTAAKGASLPAPIVAMANAVAGLVRQIFKANGQPLSEPQQVAQGSRAAPALPAPTRPEFDMTPDLRQKEKVPVQRKGDDEEQGVTEGSDQQLSIRQLATISDEALDKAYGYGRSSPGNTFGWQANLKSAAYAKHMIDKGVTDIDEIADAIHKGWNVTAKAFVKNPNRFDDTEKLKAAGKLEAKLQQRAKLMNIDYSQLPDDEQEKDRVVARALLQAITGGGEQGMSEGEYDSRKPFGVRYKVFAGREGRLTTREYYTSSEEKLQRAVAKIEALDNFYEIDGYSYPKESQDVAEGRRTGEYSRVVRALGLYYPDKFSMEELNTSDWHRVIAYKADVPVEYAGKVINDFTRPYDYNDESPEDDEQDVTEGSHDPAKDELIDALQYHSVDDPRELYATLKEIGRGFKTPVAKQIRMALRSLSPDDAYELWETALDIAGVTQDDLDIDNDMDYSQDVAATATGQKKTKHKIHKTIYIESQGVAEGLTEMDKSEPSAGRDTGPREGPEKIAKPITKEKMLKHALDTLSKSMAKKDDKKKDVKEGMESFGDEYLRKAADPNRFGRFLISVEQAQAELDARAQGKQQAPPPAPLTPPAKSQGFSKEYLQGVVNGTHPRPLITKEKAQELLNQMNENIDTLMMKLKRAMVQEGRVKELADDLKTMADADFMKKYGKAKAAIRRDMKRVDEATPAMPAAPAAPSGLKFDATVDPNAPAKPQNFSRTYDPATKKWTTTAPIQPPLPDPAAWRKAPGPGYQTNAIRDRSRVNGVWRNNPQAANPMSQDPAQRMASYQEMEKRIAADNAAARAGVDNSDPGAYDFDHWLDNGMGYATPVLKSGVVQNLFKKPLNQVPPGAKILPQYDTYQQQGEYAYPVVMGGVDQAFKVRIDQVPKGAKIVQAPQQGGALFKNLPGAAPATPPAAVAKPATPATPAAPAPVSERKGTRRLGEAGISRLGKKDFDFRDGLVGDDETGYETQNEPELGMFRMGKPVEPNDAATKEFMAALTPSQQDNRFTAPAGWRYVEKDEDPARYGSEPAAATSALPNLKYDPQSRSLKPADAPALDMSPKSKFKFDRTTQSQVPADGSGANRNIDNATRDRARAYAAKQNAPAAAKQKMDWKTIYALNKATIGTNPNLIRPGMKLKMPDGSTYAVQSGDNLSKIAAKQSQINELSTEKLAQYKTAAAKDAREADKAGDFKRGDKRFGGIVKATKKQFDNDDKKVDESRAARRALMARIVNHR